jgi:hypothetical protein
LRLHYERVKIEPPEPGSLLVKYSNNNAWVGSGSPLRIGVFAHAVPDHVDLLPALSPLVCVSFLRAHIDDFQFVTPFSCVFLFVLDTVSFDRPFACSLPLHDTTALVRAQYYYKF